MSQDYKGKKEVNAKVLLVVKWVCGLYFGLMAAAGLLGILLTLNHLELHPFVGEAVCLVITALIFNIKGLRTRLSLEVRRGFSHYNLR